MRTMRMTRTMKAKMRAKAKPRSIVEEAEEEDFSEAAGSNLKKSSVGLTVQFLKT